MRDLECHEQPSMVKHVEKSEQWNNLLSEDQFEIAFEDAAVKLVRSLRKVLGVPCNGAFVGQQAPTFQRERPRKALSTQTYPNLKWRRQGGVEPNAAGIEVCQSEATVVNVTVAATTGNQDNETELEIERPSANQLMKHPLALVSCVPKDAALFLAGAVAGAIAKTATAPLDRIKLLMQVHGLKAAHENARTGIGFVEAILKIGKEEGLQGYWKGNFPQVIRVVPYSAVQLFAYEIYKKLFKGKDNELSVVGRLAAGACAGMTSTLVTYPLDVLRLRLAVDPACKSMTQVASTMLHEEGVSAFYRGLGPSLLGIAPYIALNFCVFDLVKKSLPDDFRKTPAASFATALVSATFATMMCYPLDTVRRQLQMKGTPYLTVLDAFPGIIARDGLIGLYRGFLPNALKNLPNNSIRLTTFDAAKRLINKSRLEFESLLKARREQLAKSQL